LGWHEREPFAHADPEGGAFGGCRRQVPSSGTCAFDSPQLASNRQITACPVLDRELPGKEACKHALIPNWS